MSRRLRIARPKPDPEPGLNEATSRLTPVSAPAPAPSTPQSEAGSPRPHIPWRRPPTPNARLIRNPDGSYGPPRSPEPEHNGHDNGATRGEGKTRRAWLPMLTLTMALAALLMGGAALYVLSHTPWQEREVPRGPGEATDSSAPVPVALIETTVRHAVAKVHTAVSADLAMLRADLTALVARWDEAGDVLRQVPSVQERLAHVQAVVTALPPSPDTSGIEVALKASEAAQRAVQTLKDELQKRLEAVERLADGQQAVITTVNATLNAGVRDTQREAKSAHEEVTSVRALLDSLTHTLTQLEAGVQGAVRAAIAQHERSELHTQPPGPTLSDLEALVHAHEERQHQAAPLPSPTRVPLLTSSDVVPLPDFAAHTAGARVLSSQPATPHTFWAWFVAPAHPLLAPSLEPGACWSFESSTGRAVVSLACSVRPTHVTLQHTPAELALTDRSSAPRQVRVWGVACAGGGARELLGEFEYALSGPAQQRFPLRATAAVRCVEIDVTSNHGARHTCVYHPQVHALDQQCASP